VSTRAGILIIVVLIVAIAGAAMLTSCAPTAFDGRCAMKATAYDEDRGVMYAIVHCESP
jgi:hypothetical protein